MNLRRLIFAVCFICVIGMVTPVAAAKTTINYDASKAIKYASKHWGDSTEADGTKPDCVEFVRTCVEKGGVPRNSYKERAKGRGYTVSGYMDYLVDNGYATLNKLETQTIKFTSGTYYYVNKEKNGKKAAEGDIVVYKCTSSGCGKYFHMALLTAPSSSGTYKGLYRHYAHNSGINNKPLTRIKCSKCGSKPKYTDIYALHINSKLAVEDNTKKLTGYNKVGNYYYLYDANGNVLTGTKVVDNYKYVLSADGKSVIYDVKTLDALNYRTGPSTSYTLKGTYKKGTVVPIVYEKNGWGQTTKGYWICLKYAKKTTTYPYFVKYKVKTTDALNYRTGPSTSYKIKGTHPKGKALTIIDKKNGWGKTNKGYWVKLSYTKKVK